MTGFGAAEAVADGVSVRVEARSVNHRHLQVKLRLPAEITHLEPSVEAAVRKALDRGAVTLAVHVTRAGGAAAARLDGELMATYARELTALAREHGLGEGPALAELLALPGVVAGREEAADSRVDKLARKAVRDALTELRAAREREGEALLADLQKHARAIGKLSARIGKRMPAVVRAHQRTLQQRVEELVGDAVQVSRADLAREIALIADRLDVSEELSRLEAHRVELAKLLDRGGRVGRKLDFLAQEFFREANTIGSKCGDAQVAHAVVDLKTSIERLREQVQNVE